MPPRNLDKLERVLLKEFGRPADPFAFDTVE
jgi:hypothetical protein